MRRRSGFTLVELLVVIAILLTLASMTYAVFNGSTGDKIRSGARVAQSALLGAKDRALHAKDLRGVRLTRVPDSSNSALPLVNGFVYLQPLPVQSAGNITGQPPANSMAVYRPGFAGGNLNATEVVFSVTQGSAWQAQDAGGIWPSSGVQIRIPSGTGQWYQLQPQNNSPPYWWVTDSTLMEPALTLTIPYQGGKTGQPNAIDPTDSNASCDIQLGNDVLPFHAPISLPAGVVIDLAYSQQGANNIQYSVPLVQGVPINLDIMFSPHGSVSGYMSGLGPIYLLLRDIRDATAGLNPFLVTDSQAAKGDMLILTLFPMTGLVQTFEVDQASTDGLTFVNPFNFAQQGKSAGR